MKTSVRPLTGNWSNLTYPYGNSTCTPFAFPVAVQHPGRPPIRKIKKLSQPFGLHGIFRPGSGRGGWVDLTQGDHWYQVAVQVPTTVCTKTYLRLSTPGRAYRNCCWMWVQSWCWSQRNQRERSSSLVGCIRKNDVLTILQQWWWSKSWYIDTSAAWILPQSKILDCWRWNSV